jgi:hypothetical protein
MSISDKTQQEWQSMRRNSDEERTGEACRSLEIPGAGLDLHTGVSLMHAGAMGRRVNAPLRHNLLRSLHQTHGNWAVQRHMQRSAPVSVQRSVWDDTNLKDDFWGTKQLLGDRWGGLADSAFSAAWNVGGMIPGPHGTVIGMAGTAVDAGKWGYASYKGDDAAADRFRNDTAVSAMGLIPGLGDLAGGASAVYDVGAGLQRAFGSNPADRSIPSSGDLWHKYIEEYTPLIRATDERPGPSQGGADGGPHSYPDDVPLPEPVPDNGGGHGGGPQNYLTATPTGGGVPSWNPVTALENWF